MGDMFRGKRPYDANAFKAAAELIGARSGPALLDEFPAGSIGDRSQANEADLGAMGRVRRFSPAACQCSARRLRTTPTSRLMRSAATCGCSPGAMMGGSLLGGRPKPLTRGRGCRPAGRACLSSDAGGLHELPREIPDEAGLTNAWRDAASPSRICVITAGGPYPWIIINALGKEFGPIDVLMEEPEPHSLFLKRRARKIGWFATAGQFATMVLVRLGKKRFAARIERIVAENGLEAGSAA